MKLATPWCALLFLLRRAARRLPLVAFCWRLMALFVVCFWRGILARGASLPRCICIVPAHVHGTRSVWFSPFMVYIVHLASCCPNRLIALYLLRERIPTVQNFVFESRSAFCTLRCLGCGVARHRVAFQPPFYENARGLSQLFSFCSQKNARKKKKSLKSKIRNPMSSQYGVCQFRTCTGPARIPKCRTCTTQECFRSALLDSVSACRRLALRWNYDGSRTSST